MLNVVKQLDLDRLQVLYEELVEHSREIGLIEDGTCWYEAWPLHLRQHLNDLIGEKADPKRQSSWFKLAVGRTTLIANWHHDGIRSDEDDHYICAYPMQTEFKIGDTIYQPQPGELVRINLTKTLHRTPKAACGMPRLLIRYNLPAETQKEKIFQAVIPLVPVERGLF